MRIEFDPAKDAANQPKHGVSLALATDLNRDAALVWIDDRFEYAELRMIALAPKSKILYYAAIAGANRPASPRPAFRRAGGGATAAVRQR